MLNKTGERGEIMFNNIGTGEILVIALLIILFFGTKKVPEFIKSMGEAIKEFKRSMKGK